MRATVMSDAWRMIPRGFFQSLPVRYKLLCGFSVVLILLVAFGAYLVTSTRRVDRSIERSAERYEDLLVMSELELNNQTLAEAVMAYIITMDPKWERRYDEVSIEFDWNLARELSMKHDAEELALLKEFESVSDRVRETELLILAKAKEGDVSGAFELFDSKFEMLRSVATNLLTGTLLAKERQGVDESMQQGKSLLASAERLFLGLLIGLIVVVVILSFFIASLISNPLKRLVAAAGEISRGDLEARVEISSKDEMGHLGAAFNQMADSLQRSHDDLEQQVADRTDEIAIIHDVAQILTSELDIDQVYERFAAEVHRIVPYDRVSVNVLDQSGSLVTIAYEHQVDGLSLSAKGQMVPLDGIASGEVLRNLRPLVIDDMAEDTKFWPSQGFVDHGFRSYLSVPLVYKGRPIGSLILLHHRPATYGPREVAVIERLASQIAPAIENASLYGGLQASVEEKQAINASLELELQERRRAEVALRDASEQLHAVIDNTPVILFALDRNGVLTLSEGKGLEALNREPFHVIGGSALDAYKDMPDVLEDITLALAGQPRKGTVEIEGRTFDAYYNPLRDGEGEVTGVVGVVHDITEHKRTQEALTQANEQLHTVIDNSPVILFALDRDGIFTLSEGESPEVLNRLPGEIVGTSVFDRYHDMPEILTNVRTALGGQSCQATVNFIDRTYDAHYEPLRHQDGEVVGVVGVAYDITERERVKEALKQANDRLHAVIDNTPVILFALDREGVFTLSEGNGLAGLGRAPGEVVGQSIFDFLRDNPDNLV